MLNDDDHAKPLIRNIIFLGYWSLREPLTAAAIFPYLRVLAESDAVEHLHLVTIETTKDFLPEVHLDIPKVKHHAIHPGFTQPYLLSKIDLQARSVRALARLVKQTKADLIIAKASMAGALATMVHGITGVPFHVESFEPHSSYMLDCGVWRKQGLRYKFSRYFEQRQLKQAKHLITVTHNYREALLQDGHSPERIHVIPSIVDLGTFRFQEADRQRVRNELQIPPEATVGIYVGKFGGLYYDKEAFQIYVRAFKLFPDLHLLILSPSDHERITDRIRQAGLPMHRIYVKTVPHLHMPAHLSAADFAFSTVKPSQTNACQSPVKNGEYWANGLPILMTDMVGDEYKLMRQGIGGRVFKADLSDVDEGLIGIRGMIKRPTYRQQVRELARKYRSADIIREVYATIFGYPFPH